MEFGIIAVIIIGVIAFFVGKDAGRKEERQKGMFGDK
jgi:hypothetical protein